MNDGTKTMIVFIAFFASMIAITFISKGCEVETACIKQTGTTDCRKQ